MKILKVISITVVITLGIGALAAGKEVDKIPLASDVVCQISQLVSPQKYVKVLAQIKLNPASKSPKVNTITAKLTDKNVLTASVIPILWNGEKRYNIAAYMNGKPYLIVTHVDLDAYFEIYLDGVRYPLHCFPDITENPK